MNNDFVSNAMLLLFYSILYTERETKVPAQNNPPPGAYDPTEMKMKVGNGNDRTAGILHSKTKRFVPAKSAIGPGPGE